MPSTIPLYLATRNEGKVRELSSLLASASLSQRWHVRSLSELPGASWEETGETYLENARIKAHAVQQLTRADILADDSGLEVDAFSGQPGVRSARFSGDNATAEANNRLLSSRLQELGLTESRARFICCLVYLDVSGNLRFFRGECPGRVTTHPKGSNGFGYDPHFIPDGFQVTLAELPAEEKNRISHRSRAMQAWIAEMQD